MSTGTAFASRWIVTRAQRTKLKLAIANQSAAQSASMQRPLFPAAARARKHNMRPSTHHSRQISLVASAALLCSAMAAKADDQGRGHETATPIKHLIVIIGENRGFDHVFGTYRPRHNQRISNLLSRGIVDENGRPGPNFSAAAQFTVTPQPKYFISAPDNAK